MFQTLRNELRLTWRRLLRPGQRAPSALIVAVLGAGLSTAAIVLTLVNGVLRRPLAYPNAQRLVLVTLVPPADRAKPNVGRLVPFTLFAEWTRASRTLDHLSAYSFSAPLLTGSGPTRRVPAVAVSAHLFDATGVRPAIGSGFSLVDDRPGAPRTAVLSHEFWSATFGRDSAAIGRTVVLDGETFRIIGVMPEAFRIPFAVPETRREEPQLWVSLGPRLIRQPNLAVNVLGTTADRSFGPAIESELLSIARIADATALSAGPGPGSSQLIVQAIPLNEALAAAIRAPLLWVMAAAMCMGFLACANAATLLLARGLGRRQELAVRAALGCSSSRLLATGTADGLVLGVLGAGVAVGSAKLGLDAVLSMLSIQLPDTSPIRITSTVAAGVVLIGGCLGGICGLAATGVSMRRSRTSNYLMGDARIVGAGSAVRRWMFLLVAGQAAASVGLVATTDLIVRSFRNMAFGQAGYQAADVVLASIGFAPGSAEDSAQRATLIHGLQSRVTQLPGLRSVAITSGLPIAGGSVSARAAAGSSESDVEVWNATPEIVEALGLRLTKGAVGADVADAVIIDATAAARLFGKSDALGGVVAVGNSGPTRVVGVVDAISEATYSRKRKIYTRAGSAHLIRIASRPSDEAFFVVARLEAGASAADAARAIRSAIATTSHDLVVDEVRPLERLIEERFARERFLAVVIAVAGVVTLVLTAGGTYGATAITFRQRAKEFSIRRALGAPKMESAALVLRHTFAAGAVGMVVGAVSVLISTRALGGMLFEVDSGSPRGILIACSTMAGVALIAALRPAIRAAAADPVDAMRE